jgi:carboxymethylenebutenolidase
MNRITAVLVTMSLTAFAPSARGAQDKAGLPPGEADAKARLEKSPRHGEFVDIEVPGGKVPMRSYVVYPERKEKAPVVIVIHEIFGLSDWIRSVADQLAADGFIAIAPDMLSGKGPSGGGTESITSRDDVRKLIQGLKSDEVVTMLNATRDYGKKLPASNGKTATIGFCWGGKQSFAYAVAQPELHAAVVYYGTSPENAADFAKIRAPVLGLYGSDDARVNQTIDPAKAAMKEGGKSYTPHIYDGAGHGFLRQQDGKDGANMKAAQQAWPETVKFLKQHAE